MRSKRSLVVSLCILFMLIGTVVAFTLPYAQTSHATRLDHILPIDDTTTLTYANEKTSEQWQITPLPRMFATIIIPMDIYAAVHTSKNQRLYSITRRITTSDRTFDVREFYARDDIGDFLVGHVIDGSVTSYTPNILVRPQDDALARWNHSFTDGSGVVTATQRLLNDGCREILIDGRDLTGWQEILCDSSITSQSHHESAAPLNLTPTLSDRAMHKSSQLPDVTTLMSAHLARVGNFQFLNNNEKIIAPLLVVASENMLIGTVSNGTIGAMRMQDGGIAWTYQVNGDIYGSPSFDAYAGDVIFATTHKEVHTISTHGVRRWSTRLDDPIVANPCATRHGILVADTAGNVSLLNNRDGHVIWTQSVESSVVATPVYDESNDLMIVASQSGSITAFDQSGNIAWHSENSESVLADLVITDQTLYIVGNEGTVTAFASRDGATRWANALGAQAQWPVDVHGDIIAVATPYDIKLLGSDGVERSTIKSVATAPPRIISNGIIFTTNDTIHATDLNGNERQSWPVSAIVARHDSALHSVSISTQPQFDDQRMYFADINGRVMVLQEQANIQTLFPKWYQNVSVSPMNSMAIVQSTIAPDGDLVVASSTQTISILDGVTGELRTQFTGFSALPPDAIVATDSAVIVADKIHITAYERATGKERWTLPANALHAQQLAISGKYLMHLYQTNALQAILSIVDHTTGSIVWSQPYMSSSEQRSGAIDADAVYINGIISLAIQDASFRWFSELPLMQQVRTSTAWCGVISIRTDKFGCVDAQSGKPVSTDLIPLPTDARIIANQKSPAIGVVAPRRLRMYASPDGELLWEHIPQTPIQDAIFTENNQLIVAYNDGRVSIHDAATGQVNALLRDAPIDFLTNSHYGRITPILWHQNMLYLISNSHILSFDTAAYTGAIP